MLNFYHAFFFKKNSFTHLNEEDETAPTTKTGPSSSAVVVGTWNFPQPLWLPFPKVGGMIQQLSAIHEEDTHEGGYQLW